MLTAIHYRCRPVRFPLLLFLTLLLVACYPRYPPAWVADPAIQADADVQAARQACVTDTPGAPDYACVEKRAVDALNPNVCGLAGIFVDDACLQAVWETAQDASICDRLYLEGARPTCRAYYARQ